MEWIGYNKHKSLKERLWCILIEEDETPKWITYWSNIPAFSKTVESKRIFTNKLLEQIDNDVKIMIHEDDEDDKEANEQAYKYYLKWMELFDILQHTPTEKQLNDYLESVDISEPHMIVIKMDYGEDKFKEE